jgi:hypothetical protein
MAITALNVMSGLMGMYLIRDDEEDALGLAHGKGVEEDPRSR